MKKGQGSFVLLITCILLLAWFCYLTLTTVYIMTIIWHIGSQKTDSN